MHGKMIKFQFIALKRTVIASQCVHWLAMTSGLFTYAVDDPVHFLLAAGIVGLIENCLLLLLGHGGIGIQGLGIPGQSHAEADGNLIKIHGIASSALVSAEGGRFTRGILWKLPLRKPHPAYFQ